jgi:PASTA domain-containing protein
VSIIEKGKSAIGKLLILALLLATFGVGLAGVVYMSLSGTEMKVPDIVGKDLSVSEKELAALGLKIKKRADRVSSEPINTVIEQLPKPGETVKTGQMILVVVSKAGAEGEETPNALKDLDSDDTEKIEEMISDKPKKTKANSNTKKKADTTRDVNANTATSVTNSSPEKESTTKPDTDKKGSGADEKPPGTTAPKPQSPPSGTKPVKPAFPKQAVNR